ncbi:MAG: DUF2062 domain-containing protein [Candidatus Cyclobacteriaceae bacterium M3_2C_046]
MWHKIKSFFKTYLKKGVTPHKLSLAISIGLILGIFPILGTTTIAATLIALFLRLNLVVIQAVNYAMYPIQIMLMIPFIQWGSYISGISLGDKVDIFIQTITENPWLAIQNLGDLSLAAVYGWMSLVIPLSFLPYFACMKIIHQLKPSSAAPNSSV